MNYVYTDQLYARLCELEELDTPTPEDTEEIEELTFIRQQIGGDNFDRGVTLIPEDEFEIFAREFASDIDTTPPLTVRKEQDERRTDRGSENQDRKGHQQCLKATTNGSFQQSLRRSSPRLL